MSDASEVPIERTSFDLGRLAAAVDSTKDALIKNREATEARLVASHRKMNWARGAAFVAGVVGVIGVATGLDARDAVDEMKAQRAESRIVLCEKDNETAAKINRLGESMKQIVANATVSTAPRTPEQQARVDAFLAQTNSEINRARVDSRSCDPQSVEAYYSTTTVP